MTLWAACALTVLIETALFALVGYRDRLFLPLCVCVNVATNLTLNLITGPVSSVVNITYFIYVLEAAVVCVEYLVYALVLGRSAKLFLLTLAANCLSYGIGVISFGHL